ncbi:MAG: radical SAM family heme chaperone HemW [Bacteroidetes bacterium]|nr:radical SAM family heme chaperone HemW [Bacteroidota bacterium]
MSHLYLHIPFCKQACHYCDFHFSTSQKNRKEILQAMMKELELRKHSLSGKTLETIYFGGGTPSQLSSDELKFILDEIDTHFSIAEKAEITLEANPDDLSNSYLKSLRHTPVNRLSIGIQSFRDEDLKLMNRAHTAKEAESVVMRAQDAGFANLTVDLIYGIPGLDESAWKKNLDRINELDVPHLSSYCLTVEPKTAFAQFVKSGKIAPVDDELASEHFRQLIQFAKENEFEHYEISNFAKKDFVAKHNSSYWFGESYLGIGPSAHSFDGSVRRWNVSNNMKYLNAISIGEKTFEEEVLTENERYNEYVMTHLRTMWGISSKELKEKFPNNYFEHFTIESEKWIASEDLKNNADVFILTEKGKLIADRIASDLFEV